MNSQDLKEVLPIHAEPNVLAFNPGKRYLLYVKTCIPSEDLRGMEHWLHAKGLDVVVLAGAADIELYDLKPNAENMQAKIAAYLKSMGGNESWTDEELAAGIMEVISK